MANFRGLPSTLRSLPVVLIFAGMVLFCGLLTAVACVISFGHSVNAARPQASESDIQTLYSRKLPLIVSSSASSASDVQKFMSSLRDNGTWASVDYTTGCDAQRAVWPAAMGHWNRTLVMTAAYYGGVSGAEQYVKDPNLRAAISKAMAYWFANDFDTIGKGACMDRGGLSSGTCPCGTPGLWNTNWFSNMIIVPTYIGKICLLLRDELTPTELGNCTHITARSYTPFYRKTQPKYVSGANIIGMASVGIVAGLLENNRTGNASRLFDAYKRVHDEVIIHPDDLADGIKPDGSFQQHTGIIYDGDYGREFTNSILELELQAAGTIFQADKAVRDAFELHMNGAQWMIFADTVANVLHWDYTVIGRMIALARSDNQAATSIMMNLTQVQELGDAWSSPKLQSFAQDLIKPPNTANAGDLKGNRMFWNSDYMVHRTGNTVTTLKLLSKRTKTSECVNNQNQLGFHLSDGAMYQHTTGAEYNDIFATFDWNLVPGITVDYNGTPFNCSTIKTPGAATYAGGVSAGDIGVAAMRYLNPQTNTFDFHKAWFFFGDQAQHVLINGISSKSPRPVFSVLDQRLHNGPIYLNQQTVSRGNYSNAELLWHAGAGYVFPKLQNTQIRIEAGEKSGNWKSIGTSALGTVTNDMFSASIIHPSNLSVPIEYSIFPGTQSKDDFESKIHFTPETIANDGSVSAALTSDGRVLGAAFWGNGGGWVRVARMGLIVSVDRPAVLIVKLTGDGNDSGTVHIADPTHGTGVARVRVAWLEDKRCAGSSCMRVKRKPAKEVVLHFYLPKNGLAGSDATQEFKRGN